MLKTINGVQWDIKYEIIEDPLNYLKSCECGGKFVLSTSKGVSLRLGTKVEGLTAYRCDKCCRIL